MQDDGINPVIQIVLDHFREYYTNTASIYPIQHSRNHKCTHFLVYERTAGVFIEGSIYSELKLRRQIRKKKELLNKLALIGFTDISFFRT